MRDKENSVYEKMLSDDKINTISELQKLEKKGYDVFKIFGIPRNYFDILTSMKNTYEKVLNGDTVQISQSDIDELAELAFAILFDKLDAIRNSISPEATMGFGPIEDNKDAYFSIDYKKMPIDEETKKMIGFVSSLRGIDIGRMSDSDKANWFFETIENLEKLATGILEFQTGNNGEIEDVTYRQYSFSDFEDYYYKPKNKKGKGEIDYYEK